MARPRNVHSELLNAALEGLEIQRARIEEQISQVRSMLGSASPRRPGRPPVKASAAKQPAKKRVLSPAARKRIAAAQKKRWAEFRKTSEAGQ